MFKSKSLGPLCLSILYAHTMVAQLFASRGEDSRITHGRFTMTQTGYMPLSIHYLCHFHHHHLLCHHHLHRLLYFLRLHCCLHHHCHLHLCRHHHHLDHHRCIQQLRHHTNNVERNTILI